MRIGLQLHATCTRASRRRGGASGTWLRCSSRSAARRGRSRSSRSRRGGWRVDIHVARAADDFIRIARSMVANGSAVPAACASSASGCRPAISSGVETRNGINRHNSGSRPMAHKTGVVRFGKRLQANVGPSSVTGCEFHLNASESARGIVHWWSGSAACACIRLRVCASWASLICFRPCCTSRNATYHAMNPRESGCSCALRAFGSAPGRCPTHVQHHGISRTCAGTCGSISILTLNGFAPFTRQSAPAAIAVQATWPNGAR